MARKPADQTVNREDIILAAAEVLHRNGYEATTMKDIGALVNLTAASLYHHFRNKDSLLLAVLEEGLAYAIARLEPIVAADQSNAQKLAAMIKAHVLGVTQHTAVGATMVFEIRSLMRKKPTGKMGVDESFMERRNVFFAQRDHFEDLFRQVVQAGIEAGEFYPVDVGIFVKTMLGANNWVGVWYKEGGRLSGETIAALLAETSLKALQP